MKQRWRKRRQLQDLLVQQTGCTMQHTGWPCNACFHALKIGVPNDALHEMWQATLVIRGGQSDFLPESICADMVRRQPLVRWAEVPGAGHYVHDDDPAAFVDLVADFLR